MQHTCRQCSAPFTLSEADLACLDQLSPVIGGKKESLPPPSLCPDCRLQRRFSFRNERFLYRRKCDLTGKEVISFYAPDSPVKAYDHHAWWEDGWNGLDYGKKIDFTRPFLDQFAELFAVVPRMSMVVSHCENCDFAPYSVKSKNCYMCVSCLESEDLFHCLQTNFSSDCTDCTLCTNCELCNECLNCTDLKNSVGCQYCENSSDLAFCHDCISCNNCVGCKNLRGKKFHVSNKSVTEEEFQRIRLSIASASGREEFRRKSRDFILTLPFRAAHIRSSEETTGDDLSECRRVHACFNAKQMEDCRYIVIGAHVLKNCCDVNYSPNSELLYDCFSAVNAHSCVGVLYCWDAYDCHYSSECFFSKHLFGCAGLKRKEYCILNRQYSQEDYEALVPKIIERMRQDKEWGEFFPVSLSPFAYNETIAQEYFPLPKKEVLDREWKWRNRTDETPKVEKIIPANQLPDSIDDIPDDVVNWAIECAATKRPFRIIGQELAFYRKMNLPIPRFHPDERHRRRMTLRNPRKLWNRTCAKCRQPIATSYAPDRPEIVYCEQCFLQEVY